MEIKAFLKRKLEFFPLLYVQIAYNYLSYSKGDKNRATNASTDICIEGFPRSSNSFVAKAFRHLNGKNIVIATHLHSAANVIVSVRNKKPTLVLIRDPMESIVSLYTLEVQYNKNFKLSDNTVKCMMEKNLKWYISFYEKLMKYKNYLVIASMKDTTSDINRVIEKVNRKFNRSFKTCPDHNELVKILSSENSKHMFPSEFREQYKEYGKKIYLLIDKKIRQKAINTYNLFLE
jgi:hypothetical protein